MALENIDPHNLRQAVAAGNFTEKLYFLVALDEAGELKLCTEGAAGYVLNETAGEGETATYVAGAEQAKVVLGGTVKIGEPLMSNGSGEAIVATEGHVIVGVAMEAGASGDVIEILTAVPVAKVPAS